MSDSFFTIDLSQLQPSQLYINAKKLARVQRDQNPETGQPTPLPIKQLGDDIILTDGHTRAFAAFLKGAEELEVYWDTDEMDWEAYAVCVQWCKAEGICTIGDLAGRVVESDEYAVVWLERCRTMQEEIARNRNGSDR